MTTQAVVEYTCDRCSAASKTYKRDDLTVELPFRWVNVLRSRTPDDPHADTMDLCVDCADSFESWRVASAVPA